MRSAGWLPPLVDVEFGDIMGDVFTRADAMLLGRTSHDILAAHWPNVPDEEGGAKINGMRKYVATRSPMTSSWNNTEVLLGEASQTVADLKARTDGEILVQGSSDLLRTLQAADGKRLFAAGTAPAGLRLTHSSTTGNGVVYVAYERDGKPAYGAVS
jgi:dihydrofolate reductase